MNAILSTDVKRQTLNSASIRIGRRICGLREQGGELFHQAILNKCHTCFYKMKKTREFDNYLQKCYNSCVLSDVVYKRITGKANDPRGQEANLETSWPKGNVPAEVIYR